MKSTQAIALFSSFFLFCLLSVVFAQEETEKAKPKRIRKLTRVERPSFDKAKDDIYFKDVLSEGLVGERPSGERAKVIASKEGEKQPASQGATGEGWSSLIDGTTLEDEIKTLNQSLARSVTSPVKFKTAYNDVRQTMSLLSMSFAIIREYDGQVRWSDDAAAAQAALQQAATLARSNTQQAFNYCKSRKLDLDDLIRGGSFAESEKPTEVVEWGDVVGRTETMVRLQQSDDLLKQWTADEKTFQKQKAKIIREAQWVAAIADVIAKEGMDDADVDEYVELCVAMKSAALQTIASTKSDDFDAAGKSANLVSQSCNNCHEEWR